MPYQILVPILVGIYCFALSYSSAAVVTVSKNCDNGESLTTECVSLDRALRDLTSNTTIKMESGDYQLENFTLHKDLFNVRIVGSSTLIQCANGVGLAFVNSSDILISGVEINGCRLNGTNFDMVLEELEIFVDLFVFIPTEVQVGVFLGYCRNVMLESVTVTNTAGFGLVGVNLIGASSFSNVTFSNNIQVGSCANANIDSISALLKQNLTRGGGAVLLYQDFKNDYRQAYSNQVFSLEMENTKFFSNSECSSSYITVLDRDSRFLNDLGFGIGGGGGLSLHLAQLDFGINITMSGSNFTNNIALFGSSAQISLFSGVQHSAITMNDCLFDSNGLSDTSRVMGPGGIAVINDVFPPLDRRNVIPNFEINRDVYVNIVNSIFSRNKAQIGAGVFIYSTHYSPLRDRTDVVQFLIADTTFMQNEAISGSALTVIEEKSSGQDDGIQVTVQNSSFIDNTIVSASPNASTGTLLVGQTVGTIELISINITFHGECHIQGNMGTGLKAEKSFIGIFGNLTFLGNVGVSGGALHLLSQSYIILLPHSHLRLLDNVAQVSGGAIYVNQITSNSYLDSYTNDCFISFRYDSFFLCTNCSDINATNAYVEFRGNKAMYGSYIYGSVLSACSWAYDLQYRFNNNNTIAILHENFPNVFSFEENPLHPGLVRGFASRLEYKMSEVPSTVAPGQSFSVNFSATDNLGNKINTVLSSFSSSLVNLERDNRTSSVTFLNANNFAILSNENSTSVSITVMGPEDQDVDIIIYSSNAGVVRAQTTLQVRLSSCGFGFQLSDNRCECRSDFTKLKGVTCDPDKHRLVISDNQWLGQISDSGNQSHKDASNIIIGTCHFEYCQPEIVNLDVTNDDVPDFDRQCDFNRAGVVCGGCRENYSVVIGTSIECRECSNVYILLFFLFAVAGILLVFLITFLDINITGGFLNGVIFYSNVFSIYSYVLRIPPQEHLAVVFWPSLNFGIDSCLYDGMTALHRTIWQLVFPVYLFILMFLITGLLNTKCVKLVKASSGHSIIQAFSTLMILCYLSILQSCAELVGFIEITSLTGVKHFHWIIDANIPYFDIGHAVLTILAFLLFLFYLLPLPIFLLFPSCVYKSRVLRKYKPLYDALWEPFKTECRSWLGMRLIFRWIPFFLVFTSFSVFATTLLLLLLLFFQVWIKPFKNKWRNYMDNFFILNLCMLFIGSLFTSSDPNIVGEINRSALSAYNTILVLLGYAGFVIVVLYHVFVRFPRLQSFPKWCISRIHFKKHTKPSGDETDANAPEIITTERVTTGTNNDSRSSTGGSAQKMPATFTTCELREPLLQSGTLEVIH